MRTEQLIRESAGRIFTVEFIKKNGELRKIGMRYDPLARGLLPVWDTQKQGYRMINYRFVQNTDHYPEMTIPRQPARPRTPYGGKLVAGVVLPPRYEKDPNDCSSKIRVGHVHLPEGEGWRVDVFTDFGKDSTKSVYDLLRLIFESC